MTKGNLGRRRDVTDFISGVCDIAEEQELRSLKLIRAVMDDPELRMSTYGYEEQIKKLMEHILQLPSDYPNIENIYRAGMDITDIFGRLGRDEFKGHYDKLKSKIR